MSQSEKVNFIVVIPSRYGSTRFPGKPLANIEGKPMVVRVAERAKAAGASNIYIATDDERIQNEVSKNGFNSIMTKRNHETGTDRLAEVADLLNLDNDVIVVNVQGDEPLIDPSLIQAVAKLLASHDDCSISTAAYKIRDASSIWNPSIVKVVTDKNGRALYFSRAPIPWNRSHFKNEIDLPISDRTLPENMHILHHIGIYGYRAGFLRQYPKLSQSHLERLESLEQLRALWHGYKIAVYETEQSPAPGVDQPEDLQTILKLWKERQLIND